MALKQDPDSALSNLLDGMTPKQREAISSTHKNLLILACAGSGKTEVLSRRIAYMVGKGEPKGSIIAFTFTDSAAENLKRRIRAHLETFCPEEPALGDMYVGTIHAFCLKILKEIDPIYRNFDVMDSGRKAAFIMSQYEKLGLEKFWEKVRLQPYERVGGDNPGKRQIKLMGLRKKRKIIDCFSKTLDVIYQNDLPLDGLNPELKESIEIYREICGTSPHFLMDFNEIVNKLVCHLRENAGDLDGLRERFKNIFVDEYQDVDDRQEELVRLLSNDGCGASLTVVGDDDQSIYGWRGARIENILTFSERYPDVHSVSLGFNFRSTHSVVEIAENSATKLAKRSDKESMKAMGCDESGKFIENLDKIGAIARKKFLGATEIEAKTAELDWIGERIEELLGTPYSIKPQDSPRGLAFSDMAILVRTNDLAAEIAEGLRERGINCIIRGKGGLFRNPEIQLVQSVFCLLAHEDFVLPGKKGDILDEEGTRNFVRERVEELGDLTPTMDAEEILRWVASKRADFDKKTPDGHSRRIYPQHIFQEILVACGIRYIDSGRDHVWNERVLYNFGSFSNVLAQFEEVRQWLTADHLWELCEFLHLWASEKADEGQVDAVFLPDTVQVLTIHQAKGLEWPVLFLPRIESRIFPSSNRNRGIETFLPGFDDSPYKSGDDGERRLWYVALTRCRKYLHITATKYPRCGPTDYFKEIKHDCVREDPVPVEGKLPPLHEGLIEAIPTNFSDLSIFWNCPREYMFRSLMGFRPGVKEDFGYGQQIHNVLAEIHRMAQGGKILDADEAVDLVEKRFNLKYTRGHPFEMLKNAAKKAVSLYMIEIAPDLCKKILDAERSFEFFDEESGAMISGTIDLLREAEVLDGEKAALPPVSIIDFKNHKWSDWESFDSTLKSAERQLQLYAKATKETFDMDARHAEIVFLSGTEIPEDLKEKGASHRMTVDVAQEKRESIMERVRDTVADIRKGVPEGIGSFPPGSKDGKNCGTCDFRKICSFSWADKK